jgi:3-oxoacyl-[acyl-carrier-protein] synthase II
MTTMTAVTPLVITSCGVVSSAGLGLDAIGSALDPAAGFHGGPAAEWRESAQVPGEFPPVPLAAVAGFAAEDHLGRKGVRSLDRTTQLALTACHRALASPGVSLTDGDRASTGVVIGTSTGSIRSSSEFSRETLVQDKPYLVRANLFPNTVMNCCASQVAIWNSLRGVNATIAGGRLSGLAAVRYARNAITQRHVDRALVGGVEELCPQSAWAWYLSGALAADVAIGEAAAVFFVETADGAATGGRPVLAELLACETGTPGSSVRGGGLAGSLAALVERVLARSGVPAEAVTLASLGSAGLRGLARAEESGVRAALGRAPARQVTTTSLLGETFSASAALQIACVLAAWRADPDPGPAVALVTSLGHDGGVGCLVMRKPGT